MRGSFTPYLPAPQRFTRTDQHAQPVGDVLDAALQTSMRSPGSLSCRTLCSFAQSAGRHIVATDQREWNEEIPTEAG